MFGAPWLSDTSVHSLPCLHIKNYFSHICYYQDWKIWIQTLKTLHTFNSLFTLKEHTSAINQKIESSLSICRSPYIFPSIFHQRNLHVAYILSVRRTRLFQQDIEYWHLHQLWQWLHIRALYPREISGKKKGKKSEMTVLKGLIFRGKSAELWIWKPTEVTRVLGRCSTVQGWGWGSCSLGTGCRSPGSTVPPPHRGRWLRLPAGRLWCVGYYTAP